MKRTYTAEQIADFIDMTCEGNKDIYSEEIKDALRGVASFFLIHAQKSYEELRRDSFKEVLPAERRKFPPFQESHVECPI